MPDTYVTVQGDTFDIIAYKVWQNEKLMHTLIEANPDHRTIVVFGAGETLTLPAIETPVDKGPVPPWQS